MNNTQVLEMRNNVVPIEVKRVILHEHPDLDAIAAYWLACMFSQIGFLHIEEAPIEFWPQGPPPDGRTAEEHEKEGTVCFDVGEGRFDHHPHGQYSKPFNKCATDLVAEFLGVANDKALQRILAYVRMHDLEGMGSLSRQLRVQGVPLELVEKAMLLESYSFAGVIATQRRRLKSDRKLIDWVLGQLTEMYDYQHYFWTVAGPEFENKAKIHDLSNGIKTYRIAVIESNIREVGSFSRTKEGGLCSLCVHRVPATGYTFISGFLTSEEFIEIAKIIRVWEMKSRGINYEYRFSELSESRMDACPVWYLPKDIQGRVFIVMNGGEKTAASKEVEPSVLSMDDLFAAVVWGLDSRILSKRCPRTHCLYTDCDFWPFGLSRCEKIRVGP